SSPRRALPSFPTRRSSDLRETSPCLPPHDAAAGWQALPDWKYRVYPARNWRAQTPYRVLHPLKFPLTLPFREIALAWSNSHPLRSEEHTSELQSRENLVCR